MENYKVASFVYNWHLRGWHQQQDTFIEMQCTKIIIIQFEALKSIYNNYQTCWNGSKSFVRQIKRWKHQKRRYQCTRYATQYESGMRIHGQITVVTRRQTNDQKATYQKYEKYTKIHHQPRTPDSNSNKGTNISERKWGLFVWCPFTRKSSRQEIAIDRVETIGVCSKINWLRFAIDMDHLEKHAFVVSMFSIQY